MNTPPKFNHYLWVSLTCFLAFCIGLIHHKFFYPLEFHGDAAAMHVLAKAILDEGSLLPKDFSYGNQLVFLRSSPFIALAALMGFREYDAFVFGSALSIAFWGSILSVFLNSLFKSKTKSIVFTICLLIPFGYWDSDYTLGQQSHLSNAVLALGAVIFSYKYLEEKSFWYIIISSLCIFVMSAEAPIRGLLVLAPLSVVVLLRATGLREFFIAATSMFFVFLLAFSLNKYLLIHRPILLNHLDALKFKSSGEILDNLGRTTAETIGAVSSINIFSGASLSLIGGVGFSLGLLLVLFYLYFAFSGLAKLTIAVKVRFGGLVAQKYLNEDRVADFLHLTATVALLLGALAVAGLNPDSSRHYLWVIFLFKLIIIYWAFGFIRKFFPFTVGSVALIALSASASSWIGSLVKYDFSLNNPVNSRVSSQAVQDIRLASKQTDINTIYGEDFWRMMPLNSFIHELDAQALLLDNSTLRPYHWLTRPSWACTDNEVLYYLKDGLVDKAIQNALIKSGARVITKRADYAIWAGPRVWGLSSSPGCYETQLHYFDQPLASLPSMIGAMQNGYRVSDGQPGFLIYGPYASIKSGDYELTVVGSSKFSNGSYIDVVSGSGAVVHARFEVENSSENFLLESGSINLPKNVSDLEIRVWAEKDSVIQIKGYELTQVVK